MTSLKRGPNRESLGGGPLRRLWTGWAGDSSPDLEALLFTGRTPLTGGRRSSNHQPFVALATSNCERRVITVLFLSRHLSHELPGAKQALSITQQP